MLMRHVVLLPAVWKSKLTPVNRFQYVVGYNCSKRYMGGTVEEKRRLWLDGMIFEINTDEAGNGPCTNGTDILKHENEGGKILPF